MALKTQNFADVLDKRFREFFDDEYTNLPDRVDEFYEVITGSQRTERFGQIGGLPEMGQLTGSVDYQEVNQGYDSLATPLWFAQGIQVERDLVENDQHSIIMSKPKALGNSVYRRRQRDRARPFNNAFSVDTLFYQNTEGVAMCSNSHTTTSGASTATGFDNYVTTALSATSLASLRIQMLKHRNDQGLEIEIMPDTLYFPIDLYEVAYEIVGSQGKPTDASNAANVHFGQYQAKEDIYLSDTNNWWLIDSKLMKRHGLVWVDRIKGEFAMVEDFDTLVGKWRAVCYWGNAHKDWRFIAGAEVS